MAKRREGNGPTRRGSRTTGEEQPRRSGDGAAIGDESGRERKRQARRRNVSEDMSPEEFSEREIEGSESGEEGR